MINSGRLYSTNWYLIHPWVYVSDLMKDLKAFSQRGFRGYADRDVWELCDYLSEWLPCALRHLAANAYGYLPELAGKDEDEKLESWKEILLKIAEGFEAHHKIDSYLYSEEEEDQLLKQKEEGLSLFVRYFGDLWD